MTQILGNKGNKDAALSLLESILIRHLFNGIKPSDETQVMQHLAWMKAQTAVLNVNCKIETVPELQMTRVVLEYSHQAIPPMAKN